MKTRSFSWEDLPKMYDDYDLHERTYFGKEKSDNDKEMEHMKRLYSMSQMERPASMPLQVQFDFAVALSQIAAGKEIEERAIEVLTRTGHIKGKVSEGQKEDVRSRLSLARKWAELHAPEKYRFRLQDKVKADVPADIRKAVIAVREKLRSKDMGEDELLDLFYEASKKNGVKTRDFFRAMYRILIGKDYGPRLAPFIISIGKYKVLKLLDQL